VEPGFPLHRFAPKQFEDVRSGAFMTGRGAVAFNIVVPDRARSQPAPEIGPVPHFAATTDFRGRE
jgi:hypothetical protein